MQDDLELIKRQKAHRQADISRTTEMMKRDLAISAGELRQQ
jgi:hypothetical protein